MSRATPKVREDKQPHPGWQRLGSVWISPEEWKRYQRWLKASDDKLASFSKLEQQQIGR